MNLKNILVTNQKVGERDARLTKQRPLNFDVKKQFGLCIKFLMMLFNVFLTNEVDELDYKEITFQ